MIEADTFAETVNNLVVSRVSRGSVGRVDMPAAVKTLLGTPDGP